MNPDMMNPFLTFVAIVAGFVVGSLLSELITWVLSAVVRSFSQAQRTLHQILTEEAQAQRREPNGEGPVG